MNQRPLLVVSCDGLSTAALGCYGSSWNSTPAIDRLAARGTIWDRLIATSDDPDQVLAQCWFPSVGQSTGAGRATHWQRLASDLGPVELITDDPSVLEQGKGEGFDQVTVVADAPPVASTPATELASPDEQLSRTALGRLIATAIERCDTGNACGALWLHTDCLIRSWDAPRFLAVSDEREEEDEEPSNEADFAIDAAPLEQREATVPWVFPDVTPPCLRVDEDFDPDTVSAWMRTYGCQIRLLDLMLELLLETFVSLEPTVVLMGTSGFALGQNDWIGHRAGPLRSCHARIPLLVVNELPLRVPQLTSSIELPNILAAVTRGEVPLVTPPAWAQHADPLLPKVRTVSREKAVAITTPRWFCVRDPTHTALFVKPDDVEDANDISRLRPEVTAELGQATNDITSASDQ